MKWAIILVFLAGCATEAPAPPLPDSFDTELEPTSCSGAFFAYTPEFSATERWLPPGYSAADASKILGEIAYDTGVTNRAFMGVFGTACEEMEILSFWILIEQPSLSGRAGIHWYEVTAFHENATFTPGIHGASHEAMDGKFVDALNLTEYEAFQGDTELIDLDVAASAYLFSLNGNNTVWQATTSGTLALEASINAKAESGSGRCISDVEWIQDFTHNCTPDAPVLFGKISKMDYEGTFRFYENQFPR